MIAAGIVPPGLEGSGESLANLLATVVGPGLGLEIVSKVNDIPKGSRLAVSTNLLASLIAACMRATGQAQLTDRPAGGGRASPRGRPRHPGRMAGRLRRRLAGFGRRLAGHQADRGCARQPKATRSAASAAAACCRAIPSLARDARSRRGAPRLAGKPGAGPRRHGAERRPDPGDGHGKVPAALRGRVAGPASKRWHLSTTLLAALRAGDVRALGAADRREFRRADPDDHSLGQQRVHRDADRAASPALRRGFLGFLDARRHVGRRHGFPVCARAARPRPRTSCSRR